MCFQIQSDVTSVTYRTHLQYFSPTYTALCFSIVSLSLSSPPLNTLDFCFTPCLKPNVYIQLNQIPLLSISFLLLATVRFYYHVCCHQGSICTFFYPSFYQCYVSLYHKCICEAFCDLVNVPLLLQVEECYTQLCAAY